MLDYTQTVERCLSCGSQRFERSSRGLSCKMCGHVIKKPSNKTEKPKSNAFVVKGPKYIYSQHGVNGFDVPKGRFAIASLEKVDNGTIQEVCRFPMLFDNETNATNLANSLTFTAQKKAVVARKETTSEELSEINYGEEFEISCNYDPNLYVQVESVKVEREHRKNISESIQEVIELSHSTEKNLHDSCHVTFECESCMGIFSVNPKLGASKHLLSCPRCGIIITRSAE